MDKNDIIYMEKSKDKESVSAHMSGYPKIHQKIKERKMCQPMYLQTESQGKSKGKSNLKK